MRACVRACVCVRAGACVFVYMCVCVHVCLCTWMCLGGGEWLCVVWRACVAMCVVVFLSGTWFQIVKALPDVFSHQRHCDEDRGAQMIFTEENAASEKYENMFFLPIAIGILSLFPVFCRIVLLF